MDTKLTIKLDNEVISRAKKYAQNRKTSLSKMIESFLDSVTKDETDDIEITPLVKSLSGVVRLPENFDYKKERADFLIKSTPEMKRIFLTQILYLTFLHTECHILLPPNYFPLADKKKLSFPFQHSAWLTLITYYQNNILKRR